MLTDQTAFHVACFAFFALLRFVTATTTRKMADVLFVEDPGTLFTLEASYADGPVQVAHAVKLFSESKSNVTLLAVTLEEERWHLQLSDKCEGYMMGQKMLAGLWNSSDPSNIAIIFYEDKNPLEWPEGHRFEDICVPLPAKFQRRKFIALWSRADDPDPGDENQLDDEMAAMFEEEGEKVPHKGTEVDSADEEEMAAIESLLKQQKVLGSRRKMVAKGKAKKRKLARNLAAHSAKAKLAKLDPPTPPMPPPPEAPPDPPESPGAVSSADDGPPELESNKKKPKVLVGGWETLSVPNGTLHFNPVLGKLNAHCTKHSVQGCKCKMDKSLLMLNPSGGRPVGMLMAWLGNAPSKKESHYDYKSRLRLAASHPDRLKGRKDFMDHMATLDAEQRDLANRILMAERDPKPELDQMGEPLFCS